MLSAARPLRASARPPLAAGSAVLMVTAAAAAMPPPSGRAPALVMAAPLAAWRVVARAAIVVRGTHPSAPSTPPPRPMGRPLLDPVPNVLN
eukprot:10832103-Alexandrium_andersonii.AAC.1